MRAIRFAVPLVASMAMSTPALAQDEAERDASSQVAEQLRDPSTQATVTATAAILGELLLDLPVGPLVQALDEAVDTMAEETGTEAPPRKDVAPDASLRDMIGPDGDRVASKVAQKMPQAMEAAAVLAENAEQLQPVLEDLGKKLRAAMPKSLPKFPLPQRD